MRLIDADHLKNKLGVWWDKQDEIFAEMIDECPTINPQEPKTGHWIVSKEKSLARCSNCKFLLKDKDEIKLFDTFVQGYNYCPYCGCKMEREEV